MPTYTPRVSEAVPVSATHPADIDAAAWRVLALRWGTLAVAGSWLGYFLFTGMPQLSFDVFPRTIQMHAVAGGAAVLYVGYLALARRLPGGSPLDLPVLGILLAWTMATVVSVNTRVSIEATLQVGLFVLAFYVLADAPWLDAQQLRRMALLLGAALAVAAIWIVGQDYADYLRVAREVEGLSSTNIFPPTVPRVHGVSDHPNVLAMVLVLFVPFFALTAYRAPTAWERVLGAAGLIGGALALFLTLSRGSWLGAVAGVAFTLVGCWLTTRAHERERQGFAPSWDNLLPRDVTPTALATIFGAMALAVGGALAFIANSSTRPGWLFRSSLSPREDAWRSGLEMFGDNLPLGSGPNTFGLLYPQYSGRFPVHTQHAHNGFLQAAVDAGALGLLALGLAGFVLGFMLVRTWRDGSLDQRLLAVACAGAFIGFAVHNQVDAGNIWKAPGMALALVAAISVRNYRERDAAVAPMRAPAIPAAVTRYAPIVARASLVPLLLLAALAFWRIDRAHYDYWRGVDAFNRGDVDGVEAVDAAAEADPTLAVYRLQAGQMHATIFDQRGRTERWRIDHAIVNLEQALRLDPRSDLVRANLARAYQLAGRDEDAAQQAKITRLATNHVPPVLAVAEVYEDLGRDDDAISTYGQVISMDAGLADSSFWQGTEWRRANFQRILEASSLGINPCTFGSYIVQARRLDPSASLDRLPDAERGCRLLVVSYPNDLLLRVALARIYMQQERPDDALGHLAYAVDRQPDFGPARTELGRWYAARGDTERARHEWLVGAELDEAESVLLLGESYPPGDVPRAVVDRLRSLLGTSGSSVQNDVISVLYYRLRYGRLSPYFAIIPRQWQTAVPRLYEQMQQALAQWSSR